MDLTDLAHSDFLNRRNVCERQSIDSTFERLGGVWEATPFNWVVLTYYDGPTPGDMNRNEQGILVARGLPIREPEWSDLFLKVR